MNDDATQEIRLFGNEVATQEIPKVGAHRAEPDTQIHQYAEQIPKTLGPTGQMVRWADVAQYSSADMPKEARSEAGGVRPVVRLLNATPDPLGGLAALCGIYKGEVIRSLADVTDEERRDAWAAMRSTVLNGPLESIQFHFLIEGVSRSFTHQAVRNRFAFYAQESLRFAVVDGEDWGDRSAYPPSIAGLSPDNRLRRVWDKAIATVDVAYQELVESGVPAEDARGLMPHAIATRYHWVVSVRTLLAEAGKRLCTQAQFEWRVVLSEVARALRTHGSDNIGHDPGTDHRDAWQFALMAEALQPICYQEGRCGFMAKFDRGCKIRERVEANAAVGRPSSLWGKDNEEYRIQAIQPAEWLLDPAAARVRPDGPGACGEPNCQHAPDGGNHPASGAGNA